MLVPETEIVPGLEQWHPAVCTECAAGCGTIVRIMDGTRNIQRNGETWHERIAAIKKIEGNPLDAVSGGRLCARGQAAVQGLYHPARLRGPMKRTGERGKGQFSPISWDEAISSAAQALAKARAALAHRLPGRARAPAAARARSRFRAGHRRARSGGVLAHERRRGAQGRGERVRLEGPARLRYRARPSP